MIKCSLVNEAVRVLLGRHDRLSELLDDFERRPHMRRIVPRPQLHRNDRAVIGRFVEGGLDVGLGEPPDD